MAYFAPYIDAAGLHLPTYPDILSHLTEQVGLIYGQDIYLGEDSQDYQLLSTFALKLFDVMQLAELNYFGRSPATARGTSLDTLVRINGLQRKVATASQAAVTLTATPGAVIIGGVVQQRSAGYRWDLPEVVTIGEDGSVQALATCRQLGPVVAIPGDLSVIATPTAGWMSVTNEIAADLGRAVETDAELRARQALSVANPAQTILESLQGGLASLDGVTRCRVYQNDTHQPDENGLPPHSIEAVVEGGDSYQIAYQLNLRKDDGVTTNGTELVKVTDRTGMSIDIRYSRPANTPVYVAITLQKLSGYKGSDSVKRAIVDYISSLGIGEHVYESSLTAAAISTMSSLSAPEFSIRALTLGTEENPTGSDDVIIDYRGTASCTIEHVTVTEVG